MEAKTIEPGQCLLSVAAEAGFKWETLWNHPDNESLQAKRKHPTILKPGDRVFLPDRQTGEKNRPSEAHHKFKQHNVPAALNVRLLKRGEPLADRSYQLIIDGGQPVTGRTGPDGRLTQAIAPTAEAATLTVEGEPEEYLLKLGWLDPIDSTSGLQARLNSLGFPCGAVDDDFGKNTRLGMKAFQEDQEDLPPTKKPDQATRDKLEQVYGY